MDRCADCRDVRSVKPDGVRQIGGAKRTVAHAFRAMASSAIIAENLRAESKVRSLFRLEHCKGSNIVGDGCNFIALQQSIPAEGWHHG